MVDPTDYTREMALERLNKRKAERKLALEDDKKRKQREEAEAAEANRKACDKKYRAYLKMKYPDLLPFYEFADMDTLPYCMVFNVPGYRPFYFSCNSWINAIPCDPKWKVKNSADRFVEYGNLSDVLIAADKG